MSRELALDLGKISDPELRKVGEKVAAKTRLSHADASLLLSGMRPQTVDSRADRVPRLAAAAGRSGGAAAAAAHEHDRRCKK